MLAFFGKNSIFNQSNSVGAALEIFSLFSVFVGKKITINDHASRIWLPDCSKLAINWKNDNYAIFYGRGVNVNFFDVVVFLLVQISC